jgi:hypothetical protein
VAISGAFAFLDFKTSHPDTDVFPYVAVFLALVQSWMVMVLLVLLSLQRLIYILSYSGIFAFMLGFGLLQGVFLMVLLLPSYGIDRQREVLLIVYFYTLAVTSAVLLLLLVLLTKCRLQERKQKGYDYSAVFIYVSIIAVHLANALALHAYHKVACTDLASKYDCLI